MKNLLDEYKKFVKTNHSNNIDLFDNFKNGQSPETLFITCSDSRITPNEITGTKAGELFVIRNAGNTVPEFEKADGSTEGLTVEYAVTQLNVKDIIVCGHAHCGAMGAILGFDGLPDELTLVKSGLQKDLEQKSSLNDYQTTTAESDLDKLIEINVLNQMKRLSNYPFIKKRLESNEVKIHGWIYDFTNADLKYISLDESSFKRI